MSDSQTSMVRPPLAPSNGRAHRFSNRPKRISRRAERDRFTFLVVPVIWILALLGLAAVAFGALHYLVVGEASRTFYALAGVPLLSALMLALVPMIRGHHSQTLDEP